jgi:glutathione S-transferase
VRARNAAGVKYPALYASEAEAAADPKKHVFNCAQRAHAVTLEMLPGTLSLFGFLGCFHPVLATGSILVWVVSRFVFTVSRARSLGGRRG